MTSFYTEEELKELKLKQVGTDVLISRKASIYGAENMVIGDHVRIDDFCILSGNICIGNYVHISAYVALYGAAVGIEIRDFAAISARTTVYAVNDDYSGNFLTNPMIASEYKSVTEKKVLVGKHVIIGSNSIVLPGVILKEGGAFGSFSMIKESTEEWMMYAGIPCKRVRARKKNILELEKKFFADQSSRHIN